MSENKSVLRKHRSWSVIAGRLWGVVCGHVALAVIAALIVLVFLLLVWPTLYRYDHMNQHGSVYPVRINRLTGKTEIFYPSGWSVPSNTPEHHRGDQDHQEDQDLPASEVAKIVGSAQIIHNGFSYQAYNGSEWTVNKIMIELTVKPSSPPSKLIETVISQRRYELSSGRRASNHCGYPLPPFKSANFFAKLGFKLQPGQTWSFRVVGAKGTK